jgi:hypothetical protein
MQNQHVTALAVEQAQTQARADARRAREIRDAERTQPFAPVRASAPAPTPVATPAPTAPARRRLRLRLRSRIAG